MRTVVEETKRTSTTGGIVDDLSHHRTILLKEQFVADTNLTGWFHEHIPQTQLLVELTQQEHFDLSIGLLLRTIETSWEHLRVVENKSIAIIEIIDDITEVQ